MSALCGSDDALTDAAPPAAVSSSWLLRRCTPNIFGRETAKSWISAAGLDAYIQGSPRRLRHRSTQELARTGYRKGVGASRSPFPTTSGNRREWCSTLFDGFSSGHLCMLSWRAICGGKTNLSHFGAGEFRKSPSRVGRGASSNQRHIRLHKSGNEVHIFMRGPRVVRTPSHHNSLGKKLGPLPRETNPKGWVPTPRISAIVVASGAREVGNVQLL